MPAPRPPRYGPIRFGAASRRPSPRSAGPGSPTACGQSAGGSTARSACRMPGTGCRRPATSPTSSSPPRPRAAPAGAVTYVNELPFLDSDLYKWLEAIGWTLADPELTDDSATELRCTAVRGHRAARVGSQAGDGYLDSHFQVRFPGERFVQLPWGHELYCAGHLIQAAVAVHRATGEIELLEHRPPVRRSGRGVVRHRGRSGRRRLRPSRDRDRAGRALPRDRRVALSGPDRAVLHRPPRSRAARRRPGSGRSTCKITSRSATRQAVTGHAVRQLYLLAGVADVATETGEPALRGARRAAVVEMVPPPRPT